MSDMKAKPGISCLFYKHPDDIVGTVLKKVIPKFVEASGCFYPHYTLVHTVVHTFSK